MVRFAIAWEMLHARHILCTFRAAAPSRPVSDTALMSYLLFSDPDCFTSSDIQNVVHYLHERMDETSVPERRYPVGTLLINGLKMALFVGTFG